MTEPPARREKGADAFRTIREVSEQVGVAPHVLRFWETRFRELKPLQRSEGGNRRYYRPADVALVAALHELLHRQGYKVEGVQRLLASEGVAGLLARAEGAPTPTPAGLSAELVATIAAARDRLRRALAA